MQTHRAEAADPGARPAGGTIHFLPGQPGAGGGGFGVGDPEYHDRVLTVKPANGIDDRIKGRSDEIKQVVLNLVFNALEATFSGGEVRVGIGADRREVELNVIDTGKGMSEAVLEQDFRAVYTDIAGKLRRPSKPAAEWGWGCPSSMRLFCGMGVRSAPIATAGHGSRFTVILPTASFDGMRNWINESAQTADSVRCEGSGRR